MSILRSRTGGNLIAYYLLSRLRPPQIVGRECVSPEVNRNKNIGEKGANMQRLVFRKYLSKMSWSQQPVSDWGNLSYLLQPTYDADLSKLIEDAAPFYGPMNPRSFSSAGINKVMFKANAVSLIILVVMPCIHFTYKGLHLFL